MSFFPFSLRSWNLLFAVVGWCSSPVWLPPPALHQRDSCQPLHSPPAHHTAESMLHSPRPISYLLQHIFLRFCPPPYFHDDKTGLEGLLTGQLVPFCCSKSGSTIMWEVLIQHALKIPQQWGCCDLSQSETLAGGDREGVGKIWERKNEEPPRKGEGDLML